MRWPRRLFGRIPADEQRLDLSAEYTDLLDRITALGDDQIARLALALAELATAQAFIARAGLDAEYARYADTARRARAAADKSGS
jgi:hypothetical protein